ncbi:MAG TPA: histidine kinase [Cellulomonas sp.]
MTADTTRAAARRSDRWAALAGSAVLTGQVLGVALTVLALLLALALLLLGVGVWLFPPCVRALHGQAAGIARSHARWSGVELRVPSPPAPDGDGFGDRARHSWALLSDRDTWRLLRWAALDSGTGVGLLLTIMPIGLVGWGLEGLVVLPVLWLTLEIAPTEWYAFIPVFRAATIPYAMLLGIGFIVLGLRSGPWWLRLHGRWSASLLGTSTSELRARVDTLAASRAEARDDAAAELRRIEREVHDATQSRLVAIGLTLGTAEVLMTEDSERARALVTKARDDSSAALAELRDLMRGIRPPVLADRGLAAALESLALDAATTVSTRIDLPERLDAALETAAYFATRELLTNALKHARATLVTIEAHATGGRLTITVLDDGDGGAAILPGHGLDGVRRRLAAFDGTLAVTSPPGGPTAVRIEAPCGS